MKHLLPALFLLITAAPLLANDEGGDGAYIPSYRELVREGYGPQGRYGYDEMSQDYYNPGRYENEGVNEGYYLQLNSSFHAAPKPTQAYYGRGYVVYYGYQVMPVGAGQENLVYAFGHPSAYFRHLLPQNVDAENLSNVAVEVRSSRYYAPGDYVAQRHYPANYVTTVQHTTTIKRTATVAARPAFKTGAAPTDNSLPAIGEKPAH